ncbi:hypothetical protein E4U55_001189 [Claviceps digitariae]|nr:hypothetical protein E4U55_001189 [Claviceps digitariae]
MKASFALLLVAYGGSALAAAHMHAAPRTAKSYQVEAQYAAEAASPGAGHVDVRGAAVHGGNDVDALEARTPEPEPEPVRKKHRTKARPARPGR